MSFLSSLLLKLLFQPDLRGCTLGFQQRERGFELVNFKCSAFGRAIILISEVPEGWRTQGLFKDINGVSLQKAASQTLIHHLPLVQQNRHVVLSQSPRWGCHACPSQHRLGLLSHSVFHLTLRLFCFFLPALCRGFLRHLSPAGWAFYPQHWFFFLVY